MKVKSKKSITIRLELNRWEAETLMGLVQNTRYEDLQQEPAEIREFRKELFETLKREINQ